MRQARRFFLVLALALGAALPAAHAQKPLELMSWQGEEPGFSDWWKQVIAAFNQAHPQTPVKMTSIPFKDYLDQLTIRFASNRPPPLLELPRTTSAPSRARAGCSRSTTASRARRSRPNGRSCSSDIVWEGKTQGVLLMGYAFMMFYNERCSMPPASRLPGDWQRMARPRCQDHRSGQGHLRPFGGDDGISDDAARLPPQHRLERAARCVKDGQVQPHRPANDRRDRGLSPRGRRQRAARRQFHHHPPALLGREDRAS